MGGGRSAPFGVSTNLKRRGARSVRARRTAKSKTTNTHYRHNDIIAPFFCVMLVPVNGFELSIIEFFQKNSALLTIALFANFTEKSDEAAQKNKKKIFLNVSWNPILHLSAVLEATFVKKVRIVVP